MSGSLPETTTGTTTPTWSPLPHPPVGSPGVVVERRRSAPQGRRRPGRCRRRSPHRRRLPRGLRRSGRGRCCRRLLAAARRRLLVVLLRSSLVPRSPPPLLVVCLCFSCCALWLVPSSPGLVLVGVVWSDTPSSCRWEGGVSDRRQAEDHTNQHRYHPDPGHQPAPCRSPVSSPPPTGPASLSGHPRSARPAPRPSATTIRPLGHHHHEYPLDRKYALWIYWLEWIRRPSGWVPG